MGTGRRPPLSLVLKILLLLSKLKKPLVCLKKVKLLAMEKYLYSISRHVSEYEWSTPNRRRVSFKKLLICRSRNSKKLEMDIMGFNSSLLSAARDIDHHQIINISPTEEDDDYSISVDERAERFIQSFYEEMRRQSNSHQFIHF